MWQRPGRRRHGPRLLAPEELTDAAVFAERAGPNGVLAGARIADALAGGTGWGEVWAFGDPGAIRSLCWFGGTLIPVGVEGGDIAALAARLRSRGRGCASIVGEAGVALELWAALETHWPAPRSIRHDQPLMAIGTRGSVEPDPLVRLAALAEIESVLPAAVAMFTEELGFSPLRDGPGYRQRVTDLLARGFTYIRTEPPAGHAPPASAGRADAPVLFKTDLGAVIGANAQIHGV
ncbi:MAG: DUF4081 domain-containing protein, partial [Bifidobacteriaceae bacterium]|nr:DUF4081 domain-containing protein [Bifidobacteriaceae bacterium]